MVQQAEAFRKAFAMRGLTKQAQAAERFRQEISEFPDTPEDLEGVLYERDSPVERIVEHTNFDHDRLEKSVIFKKGPRKGQKIHITRVDSKLLSHFEIHVNEPQSSELIRSTVFEGKCGLGNVRQRVHHLRRKLEDDPKNFNIIATGERGYTFIDLDRRGDEFTNGVLTLTVERTEKYVLTVGNKKFSLPPIDGQVLNKLAQKKGKVVRYAEFGDIFNTQDERHIKVLLREPMRRNRRKVEPDARGNFRYLVHVPENGGYMLDDPMISNINGNTSELSQGISLTKIN